MPVRVGINGFGRIGRNVFRAAKARRRPLGSDIEWVAVNDLTDSRDARAPAQVRLDPRSLPGHRRGRATARCGSTARELKVLAERDPAALPWGELGVDVVIESTGLFTDRDSAAKHLAAGRQEGDHLGARHRPRRDGRARRQLRRGLRPRRARRDLERLVHDQLPRAGREGAQRHRRHQARPDDDDPRLHRRPAPAGHAAQATCAARAPRRST